jgi:hypothetical protein
MAPTPRPTALTPRADRSFVRSIAATGIAQVTKSVATKVLAEHWPDDSYLRRGAVVPTSTSGTGAPLVTLALTDLAALAAPSAGSAILSRCMQVDLGRNGVITVPTITIAAGSTSWVGEGQPIPVRSFAFDGTSVTAHKLASLTAFSYELFTHSAPTIETVLRQVLSEALGFDIDAFLFDGLAADATRPASLTEGLTPLVASAGADPNENMTADLIGLLTAVQVIGGPIVIAAALPQAARARLRSDLTGGVEVVSSAALPSGSVVAIAVNGVVAALDDDGPRFDLSRQTAFHSETAPTELASEGSPDNTVAAPIISAWQSDVISLRMRYTLGLARRSDLAVALVQSVNW